jgi:hypothetical protein
MPSELESLLGAIKFVWCFLQDSSTDPELNVLLSNSDWTLPLLEWGECHSSKAMIYFLAIHWLTSGINLDWPRLTMTCPLRLT